MELLKDNYYISGISPLGVPLGFGLRYDPKTGDYELKQKGIGGSYDVGIGLAILYKNGSWQSDALNDSNLFVDGDPTKPTALAQQLSVDMRKKVYAAYQAKGGSAAGNVVNATARPQNQNSPAGVNNNFPGTNPGISSSVVPGITGALTGILPNQLQSILEPGYPLLQNIKFESVNEDRLFKGLLKYPFDILENQQDTLQIQMYNYKAPLGETFLQGKNIDTIVSKGLQRNTALKKPLGTVILPIPGGIQDNNAISWGDDSMNSLSAAAASVTSQNLGAVAGVAGASQIGNIVASLKGANLPTSIANQLFVLSQIPGIGGSPLLKPSIVSLLLKNAGFDISAETILARGFGIVPNSNLELLFLGPTLRQFGFTWRMSPRSENEARNVKRIIRFFKQGSAPRKSNSQSGAGAASLFLGTPNVFKLSYKTAGNKEISGLNKFKICALVNMQTVYAPDGQWAAYDEGQPVSVQMTLNFQEIEPVYESDYQSDTFAGLENDNPKVKDDDVGY